MKFELVIEKKTFANGGQNIDYYDITTTIAGQKVKLQFKDNDKNLATYLLNNLNKEAK